MNSALHDILDGATVAFYSEGISDLEVRDAVMSCLAELAKKRLGAQHELSWILDKKAMDFEVVKDLDEFNAWDTPNSKEQVDGKQI